jgi:hypothetical protein
MNHAKQGVDTKQMQYKQGMEKMLPVLVLVLELGLKFQ